jgi:hypothetical protein
MFTVFVFYSLRSSDTPWHAQWVPSDLLYVNSTKRNDDVAVSFMKTAAWNSVCVDGLQTESLLQCTSPTINTTNKVGISTGRKIYFSIACSIFPHFQGVHCIASLCISLHFRQVETSVWFKNKYKEKILSDVVWPVIIRFTAVIFWAVRSLKIALLTRRKTKTWNCVHCV